MRQALSGEKAETKRAHEGSRDIVEVGLEPWSRAPFVARAIELSLFVFGSGDGF